jgi:PKD repeat protein
VSFNANTGVLSGSPNNGSAGTYTVTITATNSFGSASQTFTLHVTH